MQALYQLAREEVWACGRHCGRAVAGRAAAEAAGPSWLWGDGEVDGLWPVPIPPPSLHTELCRELFCSEDVRTQAVPPLNHREEQLPELLKWGLLDTVTACCSSGGFSAPHPLSLELQLHLPTPHSPFTSYVLQVYSVLSLVLLACVSLHLSILIPSLFSLSGKNKQTNKPRVELFPGSVSRLFLLNTFACWVTAFPPASIALCFACESSRQGLAAARCVQSLLRLKALRSQ